jgi:cytochrome P450
MSDFHIDIHDPAFVQNPYPVYQQLREHCPIMHSDLYLGFWLLTNYDDVKKIALEWRSYTSSVPGRNAIPAIIRRTEPLLPIECDPPLHSRYRALVNPVFSSARIEQIRPRIEAIARGCVDKLLAQGGGDVVADYCVPVAVGTLAEFTNLPREDAPLWVRWIDQMFDPRDRETGARATQELATYIDALIARRRAQPTDDFISMLMAQEVDGHKLSDKDLRAFVFVQFGAGFETTSDAMSVALHWLAQHPGDVARLATNLHLIPTAAEEFIRFATPIQIFGRIATHDHEWHGAHIRKGDAVAMGFGSANHDPHVFSEPERCVLDRNPNPHLAFGVGIHQCLGAPVARMEMAITLHEFCHRVSSFRLADEAPHWKTRGDRRGLRTLKIQIK